MSAPAPSGQPVNIPIKLSITELVGLAGVDKVFDNLSENLLRNLNKRNANLIRPHYYSNVTGRTIPDLPTALGHYEQRYSGIPHLASTDANEANILLAMHLRGAQILESQRTGAPLPPAIQVGRTTTEERLSYIQQREQATKDARQRADDAARHAHFLSTDEGIRETYRDQRRRQDIVRDIQAEEERNIPFSQRLKTNLTRTASLSTLGALAVGDAGPLGRSLVGALLTAQSQNLAAQGGVGGLLRQLGARDPNVANAETAAVVGDPNAPPAAGGSGGDGNGSNGAGTSTGTSGPNPANAGGAAARATQAVGTPAASGFAGSLFGKLTNPLRNVPAVGGVLGGIDALGSAIFGGHPLAGGAGTPPIPPVPPVSGVAPGVPALGGNAGILGKLGGLGGSAGGIRGFLGALAGGGGIGGLLPLLGGKGMGVIDLLMKDPRIALALGIGTGAAAAVGYYSSTTAQNAVLQNMLRADVNSPGMSQSAMLHNILGLSQVNMQGPRGLFSFGEHGFGYSPDITGQVAGTIGLGSGLRGGQSVLNATANTLAMARYTGMNPNDLGPLSATILGAGSSVHDLAQSYQELVNQQELTGISTNKMTESLQSLEQITGGVRMNVHSATDLSAIQGVLGGGVNAGTLMSGLIGATGGQAITNAALLGMSPDRYMQLQQGNKKGDWATLFSSAGKAFKRYMGGVPGAAGIDLAEEFNTRTGLLNFTGLGSSQQNRIIQMMLSGQTDQALALAQKLSKQGLTTDPQWRDKIATTLATDVIGKADATMIDLQTKMRDYLLNMQGDLGRIATVLGAPAGGGLGGGGKGGTPRPGGGSGGNQQPPPSKGGSRTVHIPGWGNATISQSLYQQYEAASKAYGVPLNLLLAQGAMESGLNPGVGDSSTGAQGIAQFEPYTLKDLSKVKSIMVNGKSVANPYYGKTIDPHNTGQATMMQALYMRELYAKEGNWWGASYDYNGSGPQAVTYADSVTGYANSNITITGTVKMVDKNGSTIGNGVISASSQGNAPHPTPKAPPQRPRRGGRSHGAPIPYTTY